MATGNRICFHRWSRSGRCVSPGCTASRSKEELFGRAAPLSLDLERRGRVIALLATHTNTQIAAEIGLDARTVAKIRREESA